MTRITDNNLIGQVKWFNIKLGYGYILILNKEYKRKRVSVSFRNIMSKKYKYLVKNEYVKFDLYYENKKYRALNVRGALMCDVPKKTIPEKTPEKTNKHIKYVYEENEEDFNEWFEKEKQAEYEQYLLNNETIIYLVDEICSLIKYVDCDVMEYVNDKLNNIKWLAQFSTIANKLNSELKNKRDDPDDEDEEEEYDNNYYYDNAYYREYREYKEEEEYIEEEEEEQIKEKDEDIKEWEDSEWVMQL
jgi:cold shock CspA family protein